MAPVSSTIAVEMYSIGLHHEVIRSVEKFANLEQIERPNVDRLFQEAFSREIPEDEKRVLQDLAPDYTHGNQVFIKELLRAENFVWGKHTRTDSKKLRLRFNAASSDIFPMPPYSSKDLIKGRVIPSGFVNDYRDQQQELRRWLNLLHTGKGLGDAELLRTLHAFRSIEGMAAITPVGVLVSFAVTTVEAAWVLAIYEIGDNELEHKIGRCSAPKRWGSPGEICGNFIIDISARGRRPRKFCSKRCGTRQHVRNKRKEPPGLGGAI